VPEQDQGALTVEPLFALGQHDRAVPHDGHVDRGRDAAEGVDQRPERPVLEHPGPVDGHAEQVRQGVARAVGAAAGERRPERHRAGSGHVDDHLGRDEHDRSGGGGRVDGEQGAGQRGRAVGSAHLQQQRLLRAGLRRRDLRAVRHAAVEQVGHGPRRDQQEHDRRGGQPPLPLPTALARSRATATADGDVGLAHR
jgi:hypothetical protein